MEKDAEQKHRCKFCSKSFPCGRSLGGHTRSHLIPKKAKNNPDFDQFGYGVPIALLPCKECGRSFQSWKALFEHMKCHSVEGSMASQSGSWSESDNEAAAKRPDRVKRYSFSVTEIDEEQQRQQQEEVALSLIILSRDTGDWGAKTAAKSSFKLKKRKQLELKALKDDGVQLEAKTSRLFACSICKKAFPSYQALGGHRASHKKFKGCCFPDSLETVQTENLIPQHECPVCFRVFSSSQALGGHKKRSHSTGNQLKNNPTVELLDLDLNLPAPEKEECSLLRLLS